jgi:glycosyltransferase involved in cell wall biosynthesis
VHAGARPSGRTRLRARGLGYVPRADLIALYGAATLVAFTSRYEGFGLPPLEAMACGAPVVTTPVASLRDVLGDSAIFVEVGDVDGLARAMTELARDAARRVELAAAGRARAATMSWTRAAEATADVYRSLGVAV